MGVGFATGNKEEMAYFRKVLQQKTEEKKALEELKRKREMKKKIRERYRKLLNRMEKWCTNIKSIAIVFHNVIVSKTTVTPKKK